MNQFDLLDRGQILAGKYLVEKPMTAGGYGVIYFATRLDDDAPVVVKALRQEASGRDPAAVDRFFREAAIAASLRHPNLVRIYDLGKSRGQVLYMVMEHLVGRLLREEMHAATALPPERVARILHQVLAALVVAHGHGLVHRDINPSNVFLCTEADYGVASPDEQVKLLDFGAAKGAEGSGDFYEQRLTQPGSRLGTPGYLAPEMLQRGAEVTALVDLYSVGIMGLEMMTGRSAFEGSAVDCAVAARMGDPKLPEGPLRIHPVTVVCQLLYAHSPDDRYPNAEAALHGLDSAMARLPPPLPGS